MVCSALTGSAATLALLVALPCANKVTEPPPPPPDVPALDGVISDSLPIRERLAKHREMAACASCHNLMDPVGFALENYDAIGRWRMKDNHKPVNAVTDFADDEGETVRLTGA